MTKSLLLICAALLVVPRLLGRENTYDSGFEPNPPSPLPVTYHDYQVLPFSCSPDKKFAFVYPKRSVVYKIKKNRLLLVAFHPFRVLVELPLHDNPLTGSSRSYYAVSWADNSSAVVFIEGSKWGPERALCIPIHSGRVGPLIDLTREVREEVQSDFERSGAPRYNDYYDYIFDSEDRQTIVDSETLAEKGWDPDGSGHIIIDCTCTTEPKGDPINWTARFQGVWDIRRHRFTTKSVVRLTLA